MYKCAKNEGLKKLCLIQLVLYQEPIQYLDKYAQIREECFEGLKKLCLIQWALTQEAIQYMDKYVQWREEFFEGLK